MAEACCVRGGWALAGQPGKELENETGRAADAETLLRGGMTVLEPAGARELPTLPMARMTGPAGRIIAVDIQERMWEGLRRRVRKGGVQERIEARLAQPSQWH